MGLPVVFLTRRETFCAAHRLQSDHFTEEENKQVFGKCNNKNGHGHNYVVEVTLKGPINPQTGMLMNVNELKKYMLEAIIRPLDHMNIDVDIPYFKDKTSTIENLSVYMWESLQKVMPNPDILFEIKVSETDKSCVRYRGFNTTSVGTKKQIHRPEGYGNISSDSD